MAESVGIVGTAAGLVSLGIQLYSGTATNLDSFKDRDYDLKAATAQLASLRQSLVIIEQSLPRLASQQYHTASLISYMACCKEELGKLDDMLQQLFDPPSSLSSSTTIKLGGISNKLINNFYQNKLAFLLGLADS